MSLRRIIGTPGRFGNAARVEAVLNQKLNRRRQPRAGRAVDHGRGVEAHLEALQPEARAPGLPTLFVTGHSAEDIELYALDPAVPLAQG